MCLHFVFCICILGTWSAHFLKRATLPWGPLQRSTGPLEAAPDSIGLSSNPAFLHIASCAYTCLISKPKIGNVLCVLPNAKLHFGTFVKSFAKGPIFLTGHKRGCPWKWILQSATNKQVLQQLYKHYQIEKVHSADTSRCLPVILIYLVYNMEHNIIYQKCIWSAFAKLHKTS